MATLRNLKRVVWDSDAEQLKALNDDQYRADIDNTKNYEDIEVGGAASYLVYTALLTQSGTDAPVATVLENTLGGTVVWTRSDVGLYVGTLAGAFTQNKTFVLIGSGALLFYANGADGNDNIVSVETYTVAENLSDGLLFRTAIEIRVYP